MPFPDDTYEEITREVASWKALREMERRRESAARRYPWHTDFARWLAGYKDNLAARGDLAGVVSGPQAIACAVFAFFRVMSDIPGGDGPRASGDLLSELADLAEVADERTVERLMAHTLLRKGDAGPEWLGAYQAIRSAARPLVAAQIRWIRNNLGDGHHPSQNSWREEVDSLVDLLLLKLIRGRCGCEGGSPALSLEPEKRTDKCRKNHDLQSWDRQMPLVVFLKRAIVGYPLPNANGFRHGMLAKVYENPDTGLGLNAGLILRCGKCHQEPNESDLCGCPGSGPADVEDLTWWVWHDGRRKQTLYRRCVRSLKFRQKDISNSEGLAEALLAGHPIQLRDESIERLEAILAQSGRPKTRSRELRTALVEELNRLLDEPGLLVTGRTFLRDQDSPAYFTKDDRERLSPGGTTPTKPDALRRTTRAVLQAIFGAFLIRVGCDRYYRAGEMTCPRCGPDLQYKSPHPGVSWTRS